jgi:hypothetical protein
VISCAVVNCGEGKRMRRRVWFCLFGLLLGLLVLALGSAARAEVVGVSDCLKTGRMFCLSVDTFQNITASDAARTDGKRFTYADWQISNPSANTFTLTHPTIIVTLTDYCGADVVCPKAQQTSAFVLPASPNACSGGGQSITCTYANLAPGGQAPLTTAYFKTADSPATGTLITVTGIVKERSNDANGCQTGDPNCDTFTKTLFNSYEPLPYEADTYALNGLPFHLASDAGNYAFDFTSHSAAPFLAHFEALDPSQTSDWCFGTVPCFDRTLFVDTKENVAYGTHVLFYARLSNLPVSANNLNFVHFYDPIDFTVSSSRFSPNTGLDFSRMDGVQIGTTKYYVVGYQPTSNSFQLSTSAGGPPSSFPDSTALAGSPIRIIGDQNDERTMNTGCTFTFSNAIPIPSICDKKVKGTSGTYDAYVWDQGNGHGTY